LPCPDLGGTSRLVDLLAVGLRNFLWASDFPGLDSRWPDSKAMGHALAEAALGKEALNQLVFENAASLYKIPVTLPPIQTDLDSGRFCFSSQYEVVKDAHHRRHGRDRRASSWIDMLAGLSR
jgi:hypothetical protein